ncbi:hybrid sensor histidine kinase/response regulator [Desulfosarcina ovata]|uniref:histidine kinase n=1 Tax=Desulfosarcina ovata subsp. ovata TaxID=2752305 RepID=A0A5K8AEJ1_9BACT|nr:hybrid sensor histidine kinase/response regulator [Desulfosarcina ovata]BBO90908.1 hybrid sensor histidine kinase/response regulator [Desulfosarcina ovata subsp. ovata]
MKTEDDIDALKARISRLEDNRRYIQNALEMVLSFEDFFAEIGGDHSGLDTLLPEAKRRIDAIFPFEMLAFYMVDEQDASFRPAFFYPRDCGDTIRQEVDAMVEKGYFAWAIRERRGVIISSRDHSRQYLLHVIAYHDQIKGMFGGLLPVGQTTLPDTAMTLLSIILLHVANAAESIAYTNLLKNQSLLLEHQVAERTLALTQSQQELEQAIERANALAEEAQAASRAKGDFLAKMSHELRTPLNGIIGMTEVALSTPLDANQRQLVEIIGRESFSLLRQINDVLDFSKIESGKLELEKIDFDLRRLMEEVGESFIFQTSEKGVELNVFIDPSVPTALVGDPVRLRQILLNLSGNAVKFTQTGEIVIEAVLDHRTDDGVCMRFIIRDTGVGIAQENVARIFSSFTQADNTTTRQYGGTGLGTTISKQLVELMGGEIGVESQPGEGSTFWFKVAFPIQSGSLFPTPEAAPLPSPLKILIVDSHATTSRIIATYLDHLGVSTEIAADAGQALARLSETDMPEGAIDAIITAARLPDMDGLAFKERVRQIPGFGHIAMIVVTGLKELVAGRDARSLGFDNSFSKPIKFAELKRVVADLTGAPAAAEPQTVSPGASTKSQTPVRDGHILVVDDYLVNQQVAFMHLTAAGFRVDLAENGRQAVEACARNRYDLVLMDVQMPILNGFDATAKIRQRERGKDSRERTPIIALTANAMKGDEQKCLDAGMDGYLIKPVHRHQLIKTADHWIGLKPRSGRRQSVPDDKPSTPTPPAAVVMDTVVAVDEFGDAETVKMVARQLIDNVTGQLETIRQAMAREDRECIRQESHAIKGGAATMEARALSTAAAHLEKISPSGTPAEIDAGFGDLENRFNQFREFLSQWKGS